MLEERVVRAVEAFGDIDRVYIARHFKIRDFSGTSAMVASLDTKPRQTLGRNNAVFEDIRISLDLSRSLARSKEIAESLFDFLIAYEGEGLYFLPLKLPILSGKNENNRWEYVLEGRFIENKEE
ncbi:MAG: hypothetical protein IJS61_00665 [Firmicutes bacterium]|nr:hypothetical protein [Bacillota bacterium]